jgi:hypothetical protein
MRRTWLTDSRSGRYAYVVRRLEVVRIRVCSRCGRGGAELCAEDGGTFVVPLDPVRARQLSSGTADVRPLAELALEQLAARGLDAREVVIDVADGRLRGLLSLVKGDESDVVGCTAEEGVELAIRGGLKLYASDEALAHAAARAAGPERQGGRGGDTLH